MKGRLILPSIKAALQYQTHLFYTIISRPISEVSSKDTANQEASCARVCDAYRLFIALAICIHRSLVISRKKLLIP